MSTRIGALEVQLLADVRQFRADMNAAAGVMGSSADRIGSLARGLRNTLGGVFGGLSVAFLAREFVQIADAMAGVESRLKLATRSSSEYKAAQKDVYRISQANMAPLAETATLYARLADPVRKLGGDTSTTATITESFAAALRISGASSAEASSATLQFAQAMAGGALRGEEFNAVNEAAPRVMQALEASLGKSRGELRKMAEQGQLTADVVGNALIKQFVALTAEAASMPVTVSGAMTQLQNDVGQFVTTINNATGATSGLAGIISGVALLLREFTDAFSLAGSGARTAGADIDLAGLALAAIGRVIETLVLIGSDVAFVFKGIGLEIGGLAAQAVALVRGDFAEVGAIHRMMKEDAAANRAELDRFQRSVAGSTDRMLAQRDAMRQGTLSTSENTAELGKLMRQSQGTEPVLRAQAAATTSTAQAQQAAARTAKAQADELAKATQAGQDYLAALQQRLAGVQRELHLGRELTASEKSLAELEEQLRSGKLRLTEAEQARARELIVETEAARASRDLARELVKVRQDEILATLDSAAKIEEQAAEVEAATRAYGLSKTELQALERARLDDALATAEQRLQQGLLANLSAEELDGITMQVEALRRLKQAKEEGWAKEAAEEAAQAAKDTGNEWAKTVTRIEDGLVDALMRAFESGKGFMEAFRETLKNAFKTLVLEPTIRAIMRPIAGGIGSFFGANGSATANTGSAGGGLIGWGGGNVLDVSTLPGMGVFSGMGSAASAGWGMTMSGFGGTMAALEGAGAMLAGGEIAAGLAQGLGALGPYAAAAVALYSIVKSFDKSGTPHMGSVVSTDAAGRQASVFGDPSTIMDNFSKDMDGALRALSAVSVGAINSLSGAFGGQGGYSSLARFASDNTDPSIAHFRLFRDGQQVGSIGGDSDYMKYTSDATKAFEEYTADVTRLTRDMLQSLDMPEWARKQFDDLADNATLEQLAQVADAVAATANGLAALRDGLNPLGGIFRQVAGLSSDALYQLTEFAGGIEALAQKSAGFVANYYSEDEGAAIQAKAIRDTLRGAGFTNADFAGLDTRAEFRALLESRDVNTEEGLKQVAALLNVADAFAQLTPYFEKAGKTLNQVIAGAPDITTLTAPGTQSAGSAASTLESVVSAVTLGNSSIVTAVTDSSRMTTAAIDTLRAELTASLAVVAGNTRATADYTRDIYEEQALV